MEKDPTQKEATKKEERTWQAMVVAGVLGFIAFLCGRQLVGYDTQVANKVFATLTAGPGVTEGVPMEPLFTPVPTPEPPFQDKYETLTEVVVIQSAEVKLTENQVIIMVRESEEGNEVWVGYGERENEAVRFPEELLQDGQVEGLVITYPPWVVVGWSGAIVSGAKAMELVCGGREQPDCEGPVHIMNTGETLEWEEVELYLLEPGESNAFVESVSGW